MSHFRAINRDVDFLLPPSVQDWLPEGHLARYVVEVVEGLDLSELERAYAERGTLPYHPATLLALLIYGYATGCFSSRKIERATFRRGFATEFEATFVQVLQVTRENQLSGFATVSLDGTKIHANARRHSALS
jgi:transposase